MEAYDRLVERQRKWMIYLLVLLLISGILTPYEQQFFSMLIGYVAGYYSLRFLQSRIRRFGESVLEKGTSRSLGMVLRIGGIAVIVMLALRYPEKVNIPWLAVGIGIAYIVLFIDFTIQLLADESKRTK